jgi:hypothetical protein
MAAEVTASGDPILLAFRPRTAPEHPPSCHRPPAWLACQADGGCPDQRRKARVKALGSENLSTVATWLGAFPVLASRWRAISNRISSTSFWKVAPSAARCRLNVRGCMANNRATSVAMYGSFSRALRSTRRTSSLRDSDRRSGGGSVHPLDPRAGSPCGAAARMGSGAIVRLQSASRRISVRTTSWTCPEVARMGWACFMIRSQVWRTAAMRHDRGRDRLYPTP